MCFSLVVNYFFSEGSRSRRKQANPKHHKTVDTKVYLMLYYTIVFVLTYIQGKEADMSDDTQVEENPPLLDAAGLCTYTCLIFLY